jgi:hypothetical protein
MRVNYAQMGIDSKCTEFGSSPSSSLRMSTASPWYLHGPPRVTCS